MNEASRMVDEDDYFFFFSFSWLFTRRERQRFGRSFWPEKKKNSEKAGRHGTSRMP